MDSWTEEIAAAAARLIVEDGMDYGAAKRQAARLLGAPQRAALPGNDRVEDAVREYIALFCADTQPAELAALRRLALRWMDRMAAFQPHLTGAVWQGTATRHADVHLWLFCQDPKSAELMLIDRGVRYAVQADGGSAAEAGTVLSVADRADGLSEPVTVHLHVRDHDDLRGALRPDSRGRPACGPIAAVRRLVDNSDHGIDTPPTDAGHRT